MCMRTTLLHTQNTDNTVVFNLKSNKYNYWIGFLSWGRDRFRLFVLMFCIYAEISKYIFKKSKVYVELGMYVEFW